MNELYKENALRREQATQSTYKRIFEDGSYLKAREGWWDRIGLTPVTTALKLLMRSKGKETILKIVDVGCGAGHDMELFRVELQGYNGRLDISGIDPCEEMCAYCRGRGLTVSQGGVLDCEDQYRNSAMIWSNMGLIHLPLAEFPDAVRKLAAALLPRGVLGLGFKASHEEDHEAIDPPDKRINVARFTAYHNVSSVCKLLESCDINVAASISVPSENNPSYNYAWVIGERSANGAQA